MKIFQSLFLLFIFSVSIFAQDDSRSLLTWQVQKYDITATLPQTDADRNLTAKAVLNLKNISSSPASSLTLRISQSAEVSTITVNGAQVDFSKREEKINEANSLQKLTIRIPSVQPNANLTATVDYKLNVKENSGLIALSPIGSQFLPLSFWYPTPTSWYYARGGDYAPYTIKVTAANGLTVLASGAETGNTFDQKLYGQPFFIAGNWDKLDSNGVSVYMPKGAGAEEQKRAGELAALATEAKNYVSGLLGSAPDFPVKIVSAKRGAGFSGGGSVFVDDSVFRRSKIDSQTAMNIVEAMAKVWLGNMNLVSGDGYGVIQNGLSRFIATQFIEQKYGKETADVERLRQRTAYAAVIKRDAPLNIVSPIDDFYFVSSANKGAMIWRVLSRRVGQNEFFDTIKRNTQDKSLDLTKLRSAFSAQKEFLDYELTQITDMNLLVGLPQVSGGETKVALRNTGSVEANINVIATTVNNERIPASVVLKPKSFGEVSFKTPNKIKRVEIDSEKLYPQMDYTDDVAPREFTDSDLLLVVKREYDKQNYPLAEKNARAVLNEVPGFDDVRILLARSLLVQNKTAEAEKEFKSVLEEKLPTARSLAWANVGLGEIALKSGQSGNANKFFEEAVKADAEYGASLIARQNRAKINSNPAIEEGVKSFFSQFDKAAATNSKSQLESLMIPGEIQRFASGISGQTEQWTTQIINVDKLDTNNILVETNMNIKLLNRQPESGLAVYRLSKNGNSWKLSSVEMFEVR
jgi:tetratricopeptide (TPR) repeat protein